MQVHDAEVVLVLLLYPDPILQRPQVVPHVKVATRLYAAEYSLPVLHRAYSNERTGV